MHRSAILVPLLAGLFLLPTVAAAQVGGADLRIGAGMVADFAGELDLDRDRDRFGRDWDDDLKATVGLTAHLDYDIARYVSVGGFTRLQWWESDDAFEERNFLFDIGPRINGHYDWRDFRFYLAAMPGLLISNIDDDYDGALDDPAVGFTMAITPGMEYWFTDRVGVFVEIFGWVGHYFSHDRDDGRFGDIDINMNQVHFKFGAVFGL